MHSVCQQLASVLKSTEPVPIDYKELVVKFGMLLAEASENRRVIVILDNLDQLVGYICIVLMIFNCERALGSYAGDDGLLLSRMQWRRDRRVCIGCPSTLFQIIVLF